MEKECPSGCSCTGDGFESLPSELRPRSARKSSLREVTCPGCGQVYLTNRSTDVCSDCERRGVKSPST